MQALSGKATREVCGTASASNEGPELVELACEVVLDSKMIITSQSHTIVL